MVALTVSTTRGLAKASTLLASPLNKNIFVERLGRKGPKDRRPSPSPERYALSMETIANLIRTGLLKDLLIAERSFYLNRQINKSHKIIPPGIKSDISTMLYDLTYTEMVLSLSRLYDNPSRKYPTRCIKQLYQELRQINFEAEAKEPKIYALKELKHLNDSPEMFSLLLSQEGKEFNETLITYLETMELNNPIAPAVRKLREIRDKFLGHNEDIDLDTMIPYKSIETLIEHAKEVIAFFSAYYSGVHLTSGTGNFYLSHSSKHWASKFDKFVAQDSA